MSEVRRDLVGTIKRQMIADINVEMTEEEREDHLYRVMSALTPDEASKPSDELVTGGGVALGDSGGGLIDEALRPSREHSLT